MISRCAKITATTVGTTYLYDIISTRDKAVIISTQFDLSTLRFTVEVKMSMIQRIASSLRELPEHPEPGYSIGIGDMVEAVTNIILAAAETEAPPTPRRHRARGWCEFEGNAATVRAASHAREEARQLGRADLTNRAKWRAHKTACAQLREVIDTGGYAHFEQYVAELERKLESGDQRGFHQHLKGAVGMEGTTPNEEQYIRDEYGVLVLRDKGQFVGGG